jgi:hypothetical protein
MVHRINILQLKGFSKPSSDVFVLKSFYVLIQNYLHSIIIPCLIGKNIIIIGLFK